MKNFPVIFAAMRIALGTALSAGPACAQPFYTSDGTGNLLASLHKADVATAGRTAVNARALRAYASEGQGTFGPNSPNATGGGSLGYNEMLLKF
jgi:hypothetical protein